MRSSTCATTPRSESGQRELHLPPFLGRVEIDDAIDGAGGVVRREAADHQAARRRRFERHVHQLGGPQIFDHQHVGIFAQRRARRRQQIVVAAANLALADERLAALVDDVDLALDA